MKTVATALALGFLSGGVVFAASSVPTDLPLLPLTDHPVGPAEVQYELVTTRASDPSKSSQAQSDENDIFKRIAILAQTAPGPTVYFGLVNGFESASSLLYVPPIPAPSDFSGNTDRPFANMVGLAIYGTGVFAVYRGIQRAKREGEES